MHKTKRPLSFVLAVLMIVGMFASVPFTASAAATGSYGGLNWTIDDDGVGFAPAEDGKPHTALKNIRQRLALMCGGRLEISPRESGVTTVKVTIPAEK